MLSDLTSKKVQQPLELKNPKYSHGIKTIELNNSWWMRSLICKKKKNKKNSTIAFTQVCDSPVISPERLTETQLGKIKKRDIQVKFDSISDCELVR